MLLRNSLETQLLGNTVAYMAPINGSANHSVKRGNRDRERERIDRERADRERDRERFLCGFEFVFESPPAVLGFTSGTALYYLTSSPHPIFFGLFFKTLNSSVIEVSLKLKFLVDTMILFTVKSYKRGFSGWEPIVQEGVYSAHSQPGFNSQHHMRSPSLARCVPKTKIKR